MAGFDDEIDEATCEQTEGMTIPTPVLHFRLVAHAVEGGELIAGEPVGSSRAERRRGHPGTGTDPRRRTVEERGTAGGTDPAIAERGMLDDAEHGPPPVHEANQGPEGRLPQDEGLRAVDGIQHPDPLGVTELTTALLADDAMLGEA